MTRTDETKDTKEKRHEKEKKEKKEKKVKNKERQYQLIDIDTKEPDAKRRKATGSSGGWRLQGFDQAHLNGIWRKRDDPHYKLFDHNGVPYSSVWKDGGELFAYYQYDKSRWAMSPRIDDTTDVDLFLQVRAKKKEPGILFYSNDTKLWRENLPDGNWKYHYPTNGVQYWTELTSEELSWLSMAEPAALAPRRSVAVPAARTPAFLDKQPGTPNLPPLQPIAAPGTPLTPWGTAAPGTPNMCAGNAAPGTPLQRCNDAGVRAPGTPTGWLSCETPQLAAAAVGGSTWPGGEATAATQAFHHGLPFPCAPSAPGVSGTSFTHAGPSAPSTNFTPCAPSSGAPFELGAACAPNEQFTGFTPCASSAPFTHPVPGIGCAPGAQFAHFTSGTPGSPGPPFVPANSCVSVTQFEHFTPRTPGPAPAPASAPRPATAPVPSMPVEPPKASLAPAVAPTPPPPSRPVPRPSCAPPKPPPKPLPKPLPRKKDRSATPPGHAPGSRPSLYMP
ncbi:unnamed protein product [Symbiodinium natans]|uniref:Uncharacterized protein n=1 Tax=Symbiodinium natans TaxID=878477 RepID=A0A812H6L3_9DINO|nr:unnamed protein product [Symbiodinium natans]